MHISDVSFRDDETKAQRGRALPVVKLPVDVSTRTKPKQPKPPPNSMSPEQPAFHEQIHKVNSNTGQILKSSF